MLSKTNIAVLFLKFYFFNSKIILIDTFSQKQPHYTQDTRTLKYPLVSVLLAGPDTSKSHSWPAGRIKIRKQAK